MVSFLALAMSVTLVACGPKKKSDTKANNTQKIEYITEITKDNVEEVVIEYKEVLSYYNDLKNNLKTINDVSKNPDLERDAVTAKDSINNGKTLLKNTQTLYKPLIEAKETLLKMYDISLELADNVVTDPNKYQEKLKEYDKLFNQFKDMMDKIRIDVKNVRGKAPTEDKEKTTSDEQKDQNSDDSNSQNSNDSDKKDNSDVNSLKEDSDNGSSNSSKNNSNSDSNGNSDKNNSGNNSGSSSNSNQSGNDEFVPSVSSLNNNIRSQIRSAGANAGASYKQNGGDASNIDQVAAQMFNDIEGDNPIQGSQISEARSIFISAFKQAYNGN